MLRTETMGNSYMVTGGRPASVDGENESEPEHA